MCVCVCRCVCVCVDVYVCVGVYVCVCIGVYVCVPPSSTCCNYAQSVPGRLRPLPAAAAGGLAPARHRVSRPVSSDWLK